MITADFIIGLLVITALTIIVSFDGIKPALEYFKTKPGKRVLAGIKMFVGVGVVIALLFVASSYAHAGQWFKYTSVNMGIDYTKDTSPQCKVGPRDRATSNGGLTQNVYFQQSRIGRYTHQLEWNTSWTHHSCAYSDDRNQYDGFGVGLRYMIFWK